VWRQWVALCDPLDAKDKGIQGYLLVSVAVLGPSDKLYIHSPQEIEAKDAEGSKGAAGMCLMPPSLTREVHFLVLSVFRAEGMPRMDDSHLGGLVAAGIDPFVSVEV
jgi:hypothetical protein